jgi:hypothetical protein
MHSTLTRNITMSAILLAALCGTTYAGENNQITIKQDGLANSLSVDQSLASNSVVGGVLLLNGPLGGETSAKLQINGSAEQKGTGNTAKLTITNSADDENHLLFDHGTIGILQDNSMSSAGANDAIVTVNGNGTGLISQTGGNNTASLLVTGLGSTGGIYQNGDNNRAGDRSTVGLTVSGNNSSGTITQNGSNLVSGLGVTGNGTTVYYTLNGNNVSALPTTDATGNSAGGLQVISNGATVTITQTHF